MSPAETFVNEVAGEGRRTIEARGEADRDRRGPRMVKRPYEPPLIRSEQIWKSTAVAFGKLMSLANAGLRAS